MRSADVAFIGRFADTRLLLVRWGRTSWDEMTAAVGFLRLCRVGLDGIVMGGGDTGPGNYGQPATYAYDTSPSDNRLIPPPSGPRLPQAEEGGDTMAIQNLTRPAHRQPVHEP